MRYVGSIVFVVLFQMLVLSVTFLEAKILTIVRGFRQCFSAFLLFHLSNDVSKMLCFSFFNGRPLCCIEGIL